jgi:hypothetical protein
MCQEKFVPGYVHYYEDVSGRKSAAIGSGSQGVPIDLERCLSEQISLISPLVLAGVARVVH